MNYLTDKFPKLFQNGKFINVKDVSDYLTFNNKDEKILASNYLQGKGIERKNWKNYKKVKLPTFICSIWSLLFICQSHHLTKLKNLWTYMDIPSKAPWPISVILWFKDISYYASGFVPMDRCGYRLQFNQWFVQYAVTAKRN